MIGDVGEKMQIAPIIILGVLLTVNGGKGQILLSSACCWAVRKLSAMDLSSLMAIVEV